MHDQSHGRLNGSAAAAFATICERNRNTVSVLRQRRRDRRRFVGQRYAQDFANSSRAIEQLFCSMRLTAGSVNDEFSRLIRSENTAICRSRARRSRSNNLRARTAFWMLPFKAARARQRNNLRRLDIHSGRPSRQVMVGSHEVSYRDGLLDARTLRFCL